MTSSILLDRHQNIAVRAILRVLLALLAATSHPGFAQTLTPLDELHIAADIDNTLPGVGADIHSNDTAIIVFDLNAGTAASANDLGALNAAGIDGFHRTGDGCGDSLYSLDSTAEIAGIGMRPADVFTATGAKLLDADLAGIPAGINIDAVSRDPVSCDLVVSIDSSAQLGGTAFRPDDLIRFKSGAGFSLYLATGFNLNIDALHLLSPFRMLISIDVGGALTDLDALDEQVLEISPSGAGGYQLLAFEPAMFNDSWQGADLNALWALPAPVVDFLFSDSFE